MRSYRLRPGRPPWDGKHLPIRSIRFIDPNTLQFEVESSQDEEQEEDEELEEQQQEQEQEEEERDREDDTDKKVFHFEYDVTTRTLRELANFEAPDNHPSWASVSPDGQTFSPRLLAPVASADQSLPMPPLVN